MERNKISTWSDCRRCFPRLLRVLGPIKQEHLYWKSSLSRLVLKSVHCAAKKMKRKDWKVCTCTHSEMLQKFAWLFWALAAGGSLCEGSMCKRNLMRASIIVWAKPDQNPEEGGMNSDLCIWGMSWDFREQRWGEPFRWERIKILERHVLLGQRALRQHHGPCFHPWALGTQQN